MEKKKSEIILPLGIQLISFMWLLYGVFTTIIIVMTISAALNGREILIGEILGEVFTAVIKIAPFICIYKKVPGRYNHLRLLLGLNAVQLIISNINDLKGQAFFSAYFLIWFWADLRSEKARAYFGYGESVTTEKER
ncbi:hypothetical protein [Enterococcus sp. CWB-B31]|uniref:hypothetical protein n=1 Tax=Enterococcus sp. CWB-B31 TaxID=2885159 RepID=UPI001E514CBB|nr:hypothetical protein [Enterococcus sp. CWB-B31]MCB5954240.1 hypothetical protein [Enterococcus sp. CWB-B31]